LAEALRRSLEEVSGGVGGPSNWAGGVEGVGAAWDRRAGASGKRGIRGGTTHGGSWLVSASSREIARVDRETAGQPQGTRATRGGGSPMAERPGAQGPGEP